ncbi:MAG: hypothetical protein IJV27_07645 [Prevotella sp.]|nr:hypothetical protein [Prevotella sp.]
MKHLLEKAYHKIYTTLDIGTLVLKLHQWNRSSSQFERPDYSSIKYIDIYTTTEYVKAVPASHDCRGVLIIHAPVFIATIDNKDSIISAIRNALEYSNSETFRAKGKTPEFDLKMLKVRSWKELYSTHKTFGLSLDCNEKRMSLTPYKEIPHKRGLFPDTDSERSFNIDDYNGIVEILLSM